MPILPITHNLLVADLPPGANTHLVMTECEPPTPWPTESLDLLCELGAAAYHLSIDDLRSRCRRSDFVDARRLVSLVGRSVYWPLPNNRFAAPLALARLGALLCRDHTTVMNLFAKAKNVAHSTFGDQRSRRFRQRLNRFITDWTDEGYPAPRHLVPALPSPEIYGPPAPSIGDMIRLPSMTRENVGNLDF